MKKSERFFSNKSVSSDFSNDEANQEGIERQEIEKQEEDTAQGKSSIYILEIFIVLSVKIQTMIMS
jgi:hypothetical protein